MKKHPLFTIVGHRGASGLAPENSMAAFQLAANLGVEWVELDVRMLRDGTLAVFHDATMKRTTGKPWRIENCDLERLNTVRLADGSMIPTLAQTLDAMSKSDVSVYVEIKTRNPDCVQPIISSIRKSHVNAIISSFHEGILRQARKIGWDGQIMHLFDSAWRLKKARVETGEEIGISPDLVAHSCSQEWINRGGRILVYTINDINQATKLQRAGVGGIFTDYPDKMLDGLPGSRRSP